MQSTEAKTTSQADGAAGDSTAENGGLLVLEPRRSSPRAEVLGAIAEGRILREHRQHEQRVLDEADEITVAQIEELVEEIDMNPRLFAQRFIQLDRRVSSMQVSVIQLLKQAGLV